MVIEAISKLSGRNWVFSDHFKTHLRSRFCPKTPVFVRFLVSKCMETRSDTSQALANALAKLPGTFQALRKSLFDPKRAKNGLVFTRP